MAKGLNVNLSVTADTQQAAAALQKLKQQITQLQTTSTNFSLSGSLKQDAAELSKTMATLSATLKNSTNSLTGNLDLSKFTQQMQQSGMSLQQYQAQLNKLGPAGQQAFASLANSIVQAEVPLRSANGLLSQFATTLANTARWQISSSVLHGLVGSVSSAFHYAQDLNESLNRIQIVTQNSTQQMAQFAEQANKAAKALSTTTTAYTDAALIYYQQGLSAKEVQERTNVTVKMANAAGISAKAASDQMTAIWNNFAKGAGNLEYYADVITALGASTASSTEEIAQGLEKFAAVADTVGLSYENAAAALATIVATTRQSADSVGTGLRTLFARLQSVKLGETLEDGVDLTKYTKALQTVGVSALDAAGDLRSMNDILEDLGNRWKDLTNTQQVALAQTVGGVRQYTTLMALMNNNDLYKKNQQTALGSTGTVQKQQEIYVKSWEAAQKRVKASAQTIYSDLINDEFFIKMNDGLSGFLDQIHSVIEAMGGIKGIFLAIGAVATTVFDRQIKNGLSNAITSIRTILPGGQNAILQQRQEAINLLGNNTMGQAYKEYAKLQGTYLDNVSSMSNFQKDIAQSLLQQQQAMIQNVELSEKELKIAQDKTTESRMAANRYVLSTTGIDSAQRRTDIAALRDAAIKEGKVQGIIDKLGADSNQIASLKQVNDIFKSLDISIQDFDKYLGTGDNRFFKEFTNITQNMPSDQQAAALQKLFESIYTFYTQTGVTGTDGTVSFLTKLNEDIDKASNDPAKLAKLKELKDLYLEIVNAGQAEGVKNVNKVLNLDALQQATPILQKNLADITAGNYTAINAMVDFAGAITSVGYAITSIGKLSKTWNDSTISFGSKLTTTMVTLGPAISMVLKNSEKIMKPLQLLGNTIGQFTATALSGSNIGILSKGGGLLGTLLGGSSGIPQLAIGIAAVTALIGAFKLLHDAFTANERMMKGLEDSSVDINSDLENIRNTASSLKDEFKDYSEIYNQLQNCAKGSSEWRENMSQLTSQTRELLEEYPILEKYRKLLQTDEHGNLYFTPETYENEVAPALVGLEQKASLIQGIIKAQIAEKKVEEYYGNAEDEESVLRSEYLSGVTQAPEQSMIHYNGMDYAVVGTDSNRELLKVLFSNMGLNWDWELTTQELLQQAYEQILEEASDQDIIKAYVESAFAGASDEYKQTAYNNLITADAPRIKKKVNDILENKDQYLPYLPRAQALTDYENITQVATQELKEEAPAGIVEKLYDPVVDMLQGQDWFQNLPDNEVRTAAEHIAQQIYDSVQTTLPKTVTRANAAAYFEEMEQLEGITEANVTDEGKGKFTYNYKGKTGEVYADEIKAYMAITDVGLDALIEQAFQQYQVMLEDITKTAAKVELPKDVTAEDVELLLTTLFKTGGIDSLPAQFLYNLITNELTIGEDFLKEAHIDQSTYDSTYKAAADVIEKYQESYSDFFKNLLYGDLTALNTKVSSISNGPQGEQFVKIYLDNIKNIMDSFGSELEEGEYSKIFAQILQSNTTNLPNLINGLLEAKGLEGIDFNAENWQQFFTQLNQAQGILPVFASLKTELKDCSEIVQNLDFGQTIKDEDYQKLINYNDAWENFFEIQADGKYKLVKTNKEVLEQLGASIISDKTSLRELAQAQGEVDWGNYEAVNLENYQQVLQQKGVKQYLQKAFGWTDEALSSLTEEQEKQVIDNLNALIGADYQELFDTIGSRVLGLADNFETLKFLYDSFEQQGVFNEGDLKHQFEIIANGNIQTASTYGELTKAIEKNAKAAKELQITDYETSKMEQEKLLEISAGYDNLYTTRQAYKSLIDLGTTGDELTNAENALRFGLFMNETQNGISDWSMVSEDISQKLGMVFTALNSSETPKGKLDALTAAFDEMGYAALMSGNATLEWAQTLADSIGNKDLDKSLERISTSLSTIQSLDFGQTINKDNYQILTQMTDGLESFFMAQADGTYKFIGDQKQLESYSLDLLKQQKREYQLRQIAQSQFKGAITAQSLRSGANASIRDIVLDAIGFSEAQLNNISNDKEITTALQGFMGADFGKNIRQTEQGIASLGKSFEKLQKLYNDKEIDNIEDYASQFNYLAKNNIYAASSFTDLTKAIEINNKALDKAPAEAKEFIDTQDALSSKLLELAEGYEELDSIRKQYEQSVESGKVDKDLEHSLQIGLIIQETKKGISDLSLLSSDLGREILQNVIQPITDWSDDQAILDTVKAWADTIEGIEPNWDLVDWAKEFKNSIVDENLDKQFTKLKDSLSKLQDLDFGKTIDKDTYKSVIQQNSDLASSFVSLGNDEYKFIGTSAEAKSVTRAQIRAYQDSITTRQRLQGEAAGYDKNAQGFANLIKDSRDLSTYLDIVHMTEDEIKAAARGEETALNTLSKNMIPFFSADYAEQLKESQNLMMSYAQTFEDLQVMAAAGDITNEQKKIQYDVIAKGNIYAANTYIELTKAIEDNKQAATNLGVDVVESSDLEQEKLLQLSKGYSNLYTIRKKYFNLINDETSSKEDIASTQQALEIGLFIEETQNGLSDMSLLATKAGRSILDLLSNVTDWKDKDNIMDAVVNWAKEIDGIDPSWDLVDWIIQLKNSLIDTELNEKITQFQNRANALNNLDFGKNIDKETYEDIVKNTEGLEQYFLAQIDGSYKFIGNQKQLKQLTKDQIKLEQEQIKARKNLQNSDFATEILFNNNINNWLKAWNLKNKPQDQREEWLSALGLTTSDLDDVLSGNTEAIANFEKQLLSFKEINYDNIFKDSQQAMASTAESYKDLNDMIQEGTTNEDAYGTRWLEIAKNNYTAADSLEVLIKMQKQATLYSAKGAVTQDQLDQSAIAYSDSLIKLAQSYNVDSQALMRYATASEYTQDQAEKGLKLSILMQELAEGKTDAALWTTDYGKALQTVLRAVDNIDLSKMDQIQEIFDTLLAPGAVVVNPDMISGLQELQSQVKKTSEVLDELNSKLHDIVSIIGELNFGDLISEEDYDRIVALNKELEKLFIMTTSGRQFIGSEEQAKYIADIEAEQNFIEQQKEIEQKRAGQEALQQYLSEITPADLENGQVTSEFLQRLSLYSNKPAAFLQDQGFLDIITERFPEVLENGLVGPEIWPKIFGSIGINTTSKQLAKSIAAAQLRAESDVATWEQMDEATKEAAKGYDIILQGLNELLDLDLVTSQNNLYQQELAQRYKTLEQLKEDTKTGVLTPEMYGGQENIDRIWQSVAGHVMETTEKVSELKEAQTEFLSHSENDLSAQISAYDLFNSNLIRIAGSYKNTSEELTNYNNLVEEFNRKTKSEQEALIRDFNDEDRISQNSLIDRIEAAKEELTKATQVGEVANEYNITDLDGLEEYAKHIQAVKGETYEWADALALAAEIMIRDDAIKSFSSNLDSVLNILNGNKEGITEYSQEFSKAEATLEQGLKDILNLDWETVSDELKEWAKQGDNLKKVLNGDKEAWAEMLEANTKGLLSNIDTAKKFAKQISELVNMSKNFAKYNIGDMIPEDEINNVLDMVEEIGKAYDLTADQMNEMVSQITNAAKSDWFTDVPDLPEIEGEINYTTNIDDISTQAEGLEEPIEAPFKVKQESLITTEDLPVHGKVNATGSIAIMGTAGIGKSVVSGSYSVDGSIPNPIVESTGGDGDGGGSPTGNTHVERSGNTNAISKGNPTGGSGGGGGGGGKKPKEFEAERYHLISRELKNLTAQYEYLEELTGRLYGQDKILAINRQVDALKELAAAQQILIDEAEQYRKEDLDKLKELEIDYQLDAYGNILNYDELQNYYARLATESEDEEEKEWADKRWKAIQKYEGTIDKLNEALKQMNDYMLKLEDSLLEIAKIKVENIKVYGDLFDKILGRVEVIDKQYVLEKAIKTKQDEIEAQKKVVEQAEQNRANDLARALTTDINFRVDGQGNLLNVDEIRQDFSKRIADAVTEEEKKRLEADSEVFEAYLATSKYAQEAQQNLVQLEMDLEDLTKQLVETGLEFYEHVGDVLQSFADHEEGTDKIPYINAQVANAYKAVTEAEKVHKANQEYRDKQLDRAAKIGLDYDLTKMLPDEIEEAIQKAADNALNAKTEEEKDKYKEEQSVLQGWKDATSSLSDSADKLREAAWTLQDLKVQAAKIQIEALEKEYEYMKKVTEKAFGINKVEAIKAEEKQVKKIQNAYKGLIGQIQAAKAEAAETLTKNGVDLASVQAGAMNNLNQDQQNAYKEYLAKVQAIDVQYGTIEEIQTKIKEYQIELGELELQEITVVVDYKIHYDDKATSYLSHFIDKLNDNIYETAAVLQLVGGQIDATNHKIAGMYEGINNIFATLHDQEGNMIEGMSLQKFLSLSNKEREALKINADDITAVEEYLDEMLKAIEELDELKKKGVEKVSQGFDELTNSVKEQIDLFEHYSKVIDTVKNIAELTGSKLSEQAKKLSEAIYNSSLINLGETIKSNIDYYNRLQKEIELIRKRYEETVDTTLKKAYKEQLDKMTNEANAIQETILSTWQSTLELIKNKFEETLADIVKDYQNAFSDMGDLSYLNKAYDRQKQISKQYVKDYEKYYRLSKLQRDINKTIDDLTVSTGRRNKALAAIANEITKAQKSGLKMSEYDLAVLEKKYKIEKARAELEEARNAKSTVRLQRQANGNWGYVYTANEDNIAKLEQTVEDSIHEFQKYNEEYIEKMGKALFDLASKLGDEGKAALELIKSGVVENEQQGFAQLRQLISDYGDIGEYSIDEIQKAFENNGETLKLALEVYKGKISPTGDAFQDLTDTYDETTLAMVTNAKSLVEWNDLIVKSFRDMISSVTEALDTYNQTIQDKYKEYNLSSDGLLDFLLGTLDEVAESSTKNTTAVIELGETFTTEFEKIADAAKHFEDIYVPVINNIIQQTEAFVVEIGNAINVLGLGIDMSQAYAIGLAASSEQMGMTTDGSEINPATINYNLSTSPKLNELVTAMNGGVAVQEKIEEKVEEIKQIQEKQLKHYTLPPHWDTAYHKLLETAWEVGIQYTSQMADPSNIKFSYIRVVDPNSESGYSYDLMADFDYSLLPDNPYPNAVPIPKSLQEQIKKSIDANVSSQMRSVYGTIAGATPSNSSGQTIQQNVNITANFPGVKDSNEIIKATEGLENKAAQYVNHTIK